MTAIAADGDVAGRRPAAAALARALASLHARVLYVFLASRVVTSVLVVLASRNADPSAAGFGKGPLETLVSWDGGWYAEIGAHGYPTRLPLEGGNVQYNAWAFLPLYPLIVRVAVLGHMTLWPLGAVVVSTVFGAAAAVVLAQLVRPRVGARGAFVTALLFSFGPTAFVLQSGYAESMGLFLLFAVLLLVDRHRYLTALAVAVPLAFTRPGMQAVALLVGLHLALRLVQARRGRDRLARREIASGLALAAGAGVLGFVWPWLADAVTGSPDAYLRTELRWRAGYGFDPNHLSYFTPWIKGATDWFGSPAGLIILGNVLLVAAAVPFLPAVRRIGSTVLLWYGSYGLYLLAIFFPQSSTLRLCLPLSPMAASFARLRGWRVGVALVLCVSAQGLLTWNAYGAPFGIVSTP